jgi:hypothetical protein
LKTLNPDLEKPKPSNPEKSNQKAKSKSERKPKPVSLKSGSFKKQVCPS